MLRRLSLIVAVALLIPALLLLVTKRHAPRPEPGLTVAEALGGRPGANFARADQPRRFSFPADHGPHPGFRTEWWYFTGNLATREGQRFGYQLTFFRVLLTPRPVPRRSAWGTDAVIMAHFALTDMAGRKFHSVERLSRAALGLAGAGGKPLTVHLENWSARETKADPWSMRLSASDGDVAVDLDVRSVRPVVLNGDRGLSRKGRGEGNASYYYSIPRMSTEGTVRAGGNTFFVTGLSWLDREWSTSSLEPDQAGWDWFALQLNDGRDLMFYRLRRTDGTTDPFSGGTLISADGTSYQISRNEVQLAATDWWQSPASGSRYPVAWRLTVPRERLDLAISPLLADQELLGPVRYWEGAVEVRRLPEGMPAGSGYVELTGYAGRDHPFH